MGRQTGRRDWIGGLVFCGTVALAMPGQAAQVEDLYDALRLDEMITVMREEGLAYGDELAEQMLPTGTAAWSNLISEIYDTERMGTIVEARFAQELSETDIAPLVSFFQSEPGARIVELELEARRAMIEPRVEEAARAAFREADPDDARQQQLEMFIDSNDLLEGNVASALNASLRFYNGMVDGGAFVMSESDILQDVWAQEAETRSDTQEWLYAFLMLAYEPLPDDALDRYIALSATEAGRDLNRALFNAFGAAYDEISYALGLSLAGQMQGQDL